MSKKLRTPPKEEHTDETWLIPYADILTLLLALFIVLYAMQAVDAKKFEQMSQAFSAALNSGGGGAGILNESAVIRSDGSKSSMVDATPKNHTKSRNRERDEYMLHAKQEQQQLEQLQNKMNQYIANNGLTDQLNTKLNHSELKITIKDSALFDSGRANLKPDSKQLAATVGDMMKQYQGFSVVISGHTDNRPIRNSRFDSNWDLSSARALSFMKVVLERSGIDPKQFQAVGMGEYHPVADNDSAEGQAKNRRVEVSILRKYTDKNNAAANANELTDQN